MNGNKFATGQILRKPVEVVKGCFLAGCAQKSPEPCLEGQAAARKHDLFWSCPKIPSLPFVVAAMKGRGSFEEAAM
jgi:hypothetical protein